MLPTPPADPKANDVELDDYDHDMDERKNMHPFLNIS